MYQILRLLSKSNYNWLNSVSDISKIREYFFAID